VIAGAGRTWQLVGSDGRPRGSTHPGMLGGNRRGRIYGRLDCPAALRALARGGYLANRVFFLDEATAIAAGYRPCEVCLVKEITGRKRDRLYMARKILDAVERPLS